MSYRANFIYKLLKKLRRAGGNEYLTPKKKSKFSEHVGKWLAEEGRNFITMATL